MMILVGPGPYWPYKKQDCLPAVLPQSASWPAPELLLHMHYIVPLAHPLTAKPSGSLELELSYYVNLGSWTPLHLAIPHCCKSLNLGLDPLSTLLSNV